MSRFVSGMAALTFSLIFAIAMPAQATDNPTQARVDGFKASRRSVAAIEDAIARGNAAAIVEQAKLLAEFAEKIPALFPTDSRGGFFSQAKSDIWERFPEFSEKARSLQANAVQLQQAALAPDADAGKLRLRLREVQNSCIACHQQFKRGRQ